MGDRARRRRPMWELAVRRCRERSSKGIVPSAALGIRERTFRRRIKTDIILRTGARALIKTLTFDANDKPIALGDFASNAGAVVSIVQHPIDGSLYYIGYDYTGAAIRQLSYTGNRTPIAVASANQYYGPTPLAVQLSSSGSSDPDGQAITYSWNFGDGSPVSTQANPSHSFTAPAGVPTKFTVTLTVTDSGGLSAQATLIVSCERHAPQCDDHQPGRWLSLLTDHANYGQPDGDGE